MPSDAEAAAACAAATPISATKAVTAPLGILAADTTSPLGAAAARVIAASGTILGKYRSEVEIAVQHALALGLPGANYTLLLHAPSHDAAKVLAAHNKRPWHAPRPATDMPQLSPTSSLASFLRTLPSLAHRLAADPCEGLGGTGDRFKVGRRRARAQARAADAGIVCKQVGIQVPLDWLPGFRTLLARLKRRAFRAESPLIVWH